MRITLVDGPLAGQSVQATQSQIKTGKYVGRDGKTSWLYLYAAKNKGDSAFFYAWRFN